MNRRALSLLALLAVLFALADFAGAAGLRASELFRKSRVPQVTISPDGRLLAAITDNGRRRMVRLKIRGRPGMIDPGNTVGALSLSWVDDRHLLVELGDGSYRVVTVEWLEGDLVAQVNRIIRSGWVVDSLPNIDDELLWAGDDYYRSGIIRASLSVLLNSDTRPMAPTDLVSVPKRNIVAAVADAEGHLRALLTSHRDSPDELELRYRDGVGERWRTIWRGSGRDDIRIPLGLASNGRDLIVKSNEGRDTFALLEVDSESGALGRVLFARPGVDVENVVYDYAKKEVIAAVYEEEGAIRYHHFDAPDSARQIGLEYSLPGEEVHLVSMSRDRRFRVGLATGPRHPGTYYVVDTVDKEAVEIAQILPGVGPERLVPVETFTVDSPSGEALDAFFASPKQISSPPLLVMPHGGPIGARDFQSFDPVVQYFADGGVAVLRVNYRGSAGKGRRFMEAGFEQWGRGIEDDIDAAVDHVIEKGWVDPDRICIAGFSYGGYSALISLVRNPERYRCAASFAGPTDIPLIFESSDFAASDEGREFFAEIVGDPATQYDEMIRVSPAYRVADMKAPILLAHGTKDARVDVEHFYRMQLMLSAHGKQFEAFLIEGAGHTPEVSDLRDLVSRLRRFVLNSLEDRVAD